MVSNIVGITTVTGITTYLSLAGTGAVTLVSTSSPKASGKVFKVNSIIVANDDGTNSGHYSRRT